MPQPVLNFRLKTRLVRYLATSRCIQCLTIDGCPRRPDARAACTHVEGSCTRCRHPPTHPCIHALNHGLHAWSLRGAPCCMRNRTCLHACMHPLPARCSALHCTHTSCLRKPCHTAPIRSQAAQGGVRGWLGSACVPHSLPHLPHLPHQPTPPTPTKPACLPATAVVHHNRPCLQRPQGSEAAQPGLA